MINRHGYVNLSGLPDDCRIGQMFVNFSKWLKLNKNRDLFYLEDDDFYGMFYEFLDAVEKKDPVTDALDQWNALFPILSKHKTESQGINEPST